MITSTGPRSVSILPKAKVEQCIRAMLAYAESADYSGYDPYDALKSPLFRFLGERSKWLRIGATHLFRRSPVNFRPLFGIQKGRNPKALGLFLWGYSRLYVLAKEKRYLERIEYLLDMLERLKSVGYSGNCWGHNFDWQSWTFMRPKGTPTLVNTSFIGHALLDCYELTGRQRALDLAVPIKEFILRDLHRTPFKETFCFSYTPVDTEAIHNANLLGASVLARLMQYTGDGRIEEVVLASLGYSMQHQHEDGSWYYAETEIQQWVDSFHTGFNLQAIRYILQCGLAQEYWPSYQRGLSYYVKHFFLCDGVPKYYRDYVYPMDIHCAAQAISFLSTENSECRKLADKVVEWTLANLYSGRGYFYFRKGRVLTNRIPYMRWSQAWAFHALTAYLLALKE